MKVKDVCDDDVICKLRLANELCERELNEAIILIKKYEVIIDKLNKKLVVAKKSSVDGDLVECESVHFISECDDSDSDGDSDSNDDGNKIVLKYDIVNNYF